jgi:benzoylformate decarboxylase
MLPPQATGIRSTLGPFERVFLVGGKAFMVYPWSEGPPLPEGCDLVHLSPDPGPLARAHPLLHGFVGDPSATLAALVPPVRAAVDRASAGAAVDVDRTMAEAQAGQLDATARSRYGPAPMAPMAAAHALLRSLPHDVAVVDEAITTGVYVRGFHRAERPGSYYFCRGGGLGWGMPAALGVALARQEPVLCVVGDGSAMYSPQALWTAARERLPVVFAVVDNGQYLILKHNLAAMDGQSVRTGRFVGMDLGDPAVDFLALAAAMGVSATRVDASDAIADAMRAALASGAPHLLHIPITAR